MTPDASAEMRGAPLGPGSLTWQLFGDRRQLLLLGRSGSLQNMHPAVAAALQQHSNFFADPWGRLFRSIPPILGVVFDDEGQDTAIAVRRFHTDIKGLDTRGQRYHALHPEVFWWTHVTFIESMICAQQYFGIPLTAAEKDQLVAEGLTWWRRYGLTDRPAFADAMSFERYWDHALDLVLEENETTRWVTSPDVSHDDMPPPPHVPRPVWRLIRQPFLGANLWLLNGLLPPRARQTLGLSWSEGDERRLRRIGALVRLVWPMVPYRLAFEPRARAGWARMGKRPLARKRPTRTSPVPTSSP
jgi:uncharacterized protein (DUF2236 family)